MDKVEQDKPYDEAIDLGASDDDDDVTSPSESENESQASPKRAAGPGGGGAGASNSDTGGLGQTSPGGAARGDNDSDSSSSSDDGSSTSDEDDANASGGGARQAGAPKPGAEYNPEEYKDMKVAPDIEELFQYIGRYKPHTIDLDTVLKPFIPDMIPCIGEVDAFLKIPTPAGPPSTLGLAKLDEPCLNPSDPSILDMQLRTLSKHQNLQPVEVRSIEEAEKNPREVENWIKRIDDLNRSKPAPNVQYSRKMPDIEQLMQVWPAEFEDYLQQNQLPSLAELDMDLLPLIKLMMSILDVPVYNQMTDSLHVVFTLYSEFKSNQHFSSSAGPYSFGPQPVFGQSFVGESHAPSRAPSPSQMGM